MDSRFALLRSSALLKVLLLALLSNLLIYGTEIPMLRLVEHAICERHHVQLHSHVDIETANDRCKVPSVQDELASFMGYKLAIDAVAPLLTSLPYGHLADQYGRRIVMVLACIGELLNLICVIFVCSKPLQYPIEYAFFGSAFLLIGGGRFVLFAMIYVVIADISVSFRRSQYLSFLHALQQSTSLWATPFGAYLTRESLKTTFVVIIIIQILRFPIIILMSENRTPSRASTVAQEGETSSETHDEETEGRSGLIDGEVVLRPAENSTLSLRYRSLIGKPAIPFIFICYFTKRVAFTSERFIFQYLSELLMTSVEDTAWAQIPLGLSATVVTAVVLPALPDSFDGQTTPDTSINYRYVRISLIFLVVGFTLFWIFSAAIGFVVLALVVIGLGEGLEPALQALASFLVEPEMQASLFAYLSLLDTLAKLVGGPIIAFFYAFRNGDGQTYGICFLVSTALFLGLFILSYVRTPATRRSSSW